MSSGLPMEGLQPEQAPPLSIPLSFFALAPLALVAAGVFVATSGPDVAASRWAPQAMATAHLGTLGFLAAVMFGALYQMIPVVAGAPVPLVRLAHVVFAALVAGIAALAYGLAGQPRVLWMALYLLGAGVALFWIPVTIGLWRAPTRTAPVFGMRLAVVGLLAVTALGLGLVYSRTGRPLVGDWLGWLRAHVGLGLIVWVGGLITAVSWQVIPMFYLTDSFPRWSQRLTLVALLVSLIAPLLALGLGLGPVWVTWGFLPGALVVWLLHPAVALRALGRRRRRRPDASVWFWRAGLWCAPLAFVAAIAAALLDDARAPVLFGWLAIWGWAGLIVHGMLGRITPFLVWFHRFADQIGQTKVPPMRRLLPDRWVRVAFAAHLASVIVGTIAIIVQWGPAVRVAGLALASVGLVLLAALVRVAGFKSESSRRNNASSRLPAP